MSKRQIGLGIVLLAFGALNAEVVYHYGYVGFLQAATANLASIAVLVDLTIALSLVGIWMWNDAKDRGISAVPYLVAGLFLGSIGPLAYLLRTSSDVEGERAATHLASTSAR